MSLPDAPPSSPHGPRWEARVVYRHDSGELRGSVYALYELSGLHDLIEQGPHWDAVADIHIVRINHCTSPTLTVEQAALL